MFEINGITWRIKFVVIDHPILQRQDGTWSIAACDNETKTIYLANDLHGSLLKKAICHEVAHAAMFSYDVVLSYDQEELLADLLATYGEEIIEIANMIFSKLLG